MSGQLIDFILEIGGVELACPAGRYLFHQGDPVKSIFVVIDGLVELIRYQQDGNSIVLQRATNHSVLAEASMYSRKYHCSAAIGRHSSLMELPKTRFLKKLRDNNVMAELWAAHLAGEMQSARFRSDILRRRTVADRLDGWLAWKEGGLPLKGNWKSVAEEIGVSPEALYRELARRNK